MQTRHTLKDGACIQYEQERISGAMSVVGEDSTSSCEYGG